MFYLAYGMNTNLDAMEYTCPGAVCIGVAKLIDYKLVFRIHADIESSIGYNVYGALWHVNTDHMSVLDQCEGVPDYYVRRIVKVQPKPNVLPDAMLDRNKCVDAWVYEMVDKSSLLKPHTEYYTCCTDGYQQVGLDLSQIEDALRG